MKPRTWTEKQLRDAVASSNSKRQVLTKLNLRPTGGNYAQLVRYLGELRLNTNHFTGKVWNKGLRYELKSRQPVEQLLVQNSFFQSFKLKKRLFSAKLKSEKCEECGWAKKSLDGRIPLELDHINGNSHDNRLNNLRILCPNCHSLKPTHRGRNKGKIMPG